MSVLHKDCVKRILKNFFDATWIDMLYHLCDGSPLLSERPKYLDGISLLSRVSVPQQLVLDSDLPALQRAHKWPNSVCPIFRAFPSRPKLLRAFRDINMPLLELFLENDSPLAFAVLRKWQNHISFLFPYRGFFAWVSKLRDYATDSHAVQHVSNDVSYLQACARRVLADRSRE